MPACAASRPTGANAPPAAPLRLQVETRLDFDKVVFEGPGSALFALSPDGVARAVGCGDRRRRARHAGQRPDPRRARPRGAGRLARQVTLFGEGQRLAAHRFATTDLPAFPRIGADGTLSFRFGGDLRLSGDSDGAFRGTIDIVVDYL